MLVVGFEGLEPDASVQDLLREVRPGGIILFRRNLAGPEQTARLTRALRRLYTPPPFVAVDQEGGRVSRLSPPFPDLPAAARLGALEMASVARWFGALTGRGLRALGFQLDYAPVVDLSAPERQDGIGDRAFASGADQATERAGQFLAGLEEAGVEGCLKHFPGLGGAPADTHETLPRMPVDPSAREEALVPYRRLREQAPMVMVAHAHYPDLSGEKPLPASLDPGVVSGLLRRDVGFGGVIVSDDLEMGAVVERGPFADVALAAAAAGNDQLLVCHRPDRIHAAWEALRQAVAGGGLDTDAVEASLDRIAAFKARPACRRPEEPFEAEELRLVVDEMRDLTGELERALRRRA